LGLVVGEGGTDVSELKQAQETLLSVFAAKLISSLGSITDTFTTSVGKYLSVDAGQTAVCLRAGGSVARVGTDWVEI